MECGVIDQHVGAVRQPEHGPDILRVRRDARRDMDADRSAAYCGVSKAVFLKGVEKRRSAAPY
jgi:hypothetical protein